MFHILLQHVNLLLFQFALFITGIILYQCIAYLTAGREYRVLPCVICLFILVLCHTQTCCQLSFHENRLCQLSDNTPQNLSRIDNGTGIVRKGSCRRNSQTGIETTAGCLHIIEALCQCHLIGMHIRTVCQ